MRSLGADRSRTRPYGIQTASGAGPVPEMNPSKTAKSFGRRKANHLSRTLRALYLARFCHGPIEPLSAAIPLHTVNIISFRGSICRAGQRGKIRSNPPDGCAFG